MYISQIGKMDTKQNRGYNMHFGVNLRRFLQKKKYFEGMIYLSTTNQQGFVYYFGISYLKIGKFDTFFQLGKGPIMGPKIRPGKYLSSFRWLL